MCENEEFGGVEFKDVISFQTKIMLGAQFGRVKNAGNKDDIVIACLRVGWNDAFRHTSENKKVKDENGKEKSKSVLEIKSIEWQKKHNEDHADFICDEILNNDVLLETFYAFTKATSTEAKIAAIESQFPDLKALFKPYKKTEGDKQLCFGHFQKMFNIAIKVYLCIYMCKYYLGIKSTLFDDDIINNLKNADCPVDSIILNKLSKETTKKEYTNYKWSKFGTEKHKIDQYREVQQEISGLNKQKGKSNLYYDFVSWNK